MSKKPAKKEVTVDLAERWEREAKKLMKRTDEFDEYANVSEIETLQRCARELRAT